MTHFISTSIVGKSFTVHTQIRFVFVIIWKFKSLYIYLFLSPSFYVNYRCFEQRTRCKARRMTTLNLLEYLVDLKRKVLHVFVRTLGQPISDVIVDIEMLSRGR